MRFVIKCQAQSTDARGCKDALLDAARFLEDELNVIGATFSIEVDDSENDRKLFQSIHLSDASHQTCASPSGD